MPKEIAHGVEDSCLWGGESIGWNTVFHYKSFKTVRFLNYMHMFKIKFNLKKKEKERKPDFQDRSIRV